MRSESTLENRHRWNDVNTLSYLTLCENLLREICND